MIYQALGVCFASLFYVLYDVKAKTPQQCAKSAERWAWVGVLINVVGTAIWFWKG